MRMRQVMKRSQYPVDLTPAVIARCDDELTFAAFHAIAHPVKVAFDKANDRVIVVGHDQAGNLIEVGLVEDDTERPYMVHAAPARASFGSW